VLVYRRKGKLPKNDLVVALNLSTLPRHDFELELWGKLAWKEVFNSDKKKYWGTGDVFNPQIPCEVLKKKEKKCKIKLQLPPLGVVVLK
jgi:1,4-alpha-glucan branching enzyme